jgi:hypothetical protein
VSNSGRTTNQSLTASQPSRYSPSPHAGGEVLKDFACPTGANQVSAKCQIRGQTMPEIIQSLRGSQINDQARLIMTGGMPTFEAMFRLQSNPEY